MNSKNTILSILIALVSLVLFMNCGDKSEKPVETTSAPIATETASTLSPELQKGQEIFLQNCSSCHGEKGAETEPPLQASIRNLVTIRHLPHSGKTETQRWEF